MYQESLKFRKKGDPKRMDLYFTDMMNRSKDEGKAEVVLNLMDTMSMDLETAMAALKINEADRPFIRKLVEEMNQGMSA